MDLFAVLLLNRSPQTPRTAVAAVVLAPGVVVGIVANAVALVLHVAATEWRCLGLRVQALALQTERGVATWLERCESCWLRH